MSNKVRRLEDISFFTNNRDYIRYDAKTSLEILTNSIKDKYNTVDINEYSAIMSLRDIIYEQAKRIKNLEESVNG